MDRLSEDKLYCSCTPCFRDERAYSQTTLPYFLKVELFSFTHGSLNPEIFEGMLNHAYNLFDSYGVKVSRKHIINEDKTDQFDLYHKDIELGSYGYRWDRGRECYTYFGTGIAEPRFSYCLPLPGYHLDVFPKFSNIESKILEEAREFLDALNQGNRIMAGVELSDVVLAVQQNAELLGYSFEEILAMSYATKRAFTNNRRK